jgi:iron only hydrogenase large subunit-like protein
MKINGLFPVDKVLTTRELAYLIKQNKIDLKNIPVEEADNPFGMPSGAGVIYGASGGVFESALRTVYFKATGKNPSGDEFKKVRGQEGIKINAIKIGDKTIKSVVVNGIRNAQKMLEELKKDPQAFQAMEVMACPGGCIGELRKKRAEALYTIDEKKELRFAHENPAIQKVYKEFFTSEGIIKPILHTSYSQKKKSAIATLKNSKETKE